MKNEEVGKFSFLGGILLAVLLGLVEIGGVVWLIGIMAVVVALLNIQERETMKLLLWTVGMGVVGVGAMATNFAVMPAVGEMLATIITNVGIFFTTVAAVFLLKMGYTMFSK